jgi:hypothetical protein
MRGAAAGVAFAFLALLVGGPGAAQTGGQVKIQLPDSLGLVSDEPMQVPFAPGEELLYEVKFGRRVVGEGFLRVGEVETLRGRRTYHAQMGLQGSLWPFSVDYRYDSWMDVRDLASHRYIQDQKGTDARYRAYEIYPREQWWELLGSERTGETLSEAPLDQVSFLYFIRTLPLETGDEYELNRYFKEDGNPVIIRVLRRETIRVPAGEFECIVIEPVIRTSGLFGDGGQAEVYLTDDEDRHMVYMLSRVKWLPDIHLSLKEVR